jgi:RNA recognition motif-containing protein
MPEKEELNMDARLYVGNLSKSTTQDELNVLFTQAGVVTATEVIKDRRSGESKGFAFITMSVQDEAEKAINMFNAYELSGKELKVSMAKAKDQHVGARPIIEP